MTTYRRCGKTYTRDELRAVLEAEAATSDDTNSWGGVFDFDTYLSESLLVVATPTSASASGEGGRRG